MSGRLKVKLLNFEVAAYKKQKMNNLVVKCNIIKYLFIFVVIFFIIIVLIIKSFAQIYEKKYDLPAISMTYKDIDKVILSLQKELIAQLGDKDIIEKKQSIE